MAITTQLVDELLDGEPGWSFVSVRPMSPTAVNESAVIRRADGTVAVVRRYLWPFDSPEDLDRAGKEAWLLPRLAAGGVPVPEVLGVARPPGDRPALLLSWASGRSLGEWAAELPPSELAGAWATTGAVLGRAHRVDLGVDLGPGGRVAAGGVLPWEQGSWGAWCVENVARHAGRVLPRAGDRTGGRVAVADCVEPVEAARARLDARPVRLVHTDAHAWNVIVDRNAEGAWSCTGWIDWEFAWAADPRYDVIHMEALNLGQLGPVPAAFFEAVDAGPDDLADAVYRLGFWLWMAGDDLDGIPHGAGLCLQAWRWMADLPGHLRELETLVGAAG